MKSFRKTFVHEELHFVETMLVRRWTPFIMSILIMVLIVCIDSTNELNVRALYILWLVLDKDDMVVKIEPICQVIVILIWEKSSLHITSN